MTFMSYSEYHNARILSRTELLAFGIRAMQKAGILALPAFWLISTLSLPSANSPRYGQRRYREMRQETTGNRGSKFTGTGAGFFGSGA